MKKIFFTIILLLFLSSILHSINVQGKLVSKQSLLQKYVIDLKSPSQTITLDSGIVLNLRLNGITSTAKITAKLPIPAKKTTSKFVAKSNIVPSTSFSLISGKATYIKSLKQFLLFSKPKGQTTQAFLYVGEGTLCLNSDQADGFYGNYDVQPDEETACLLFISDYDGNKPGTDISTTNGFTDPRNNFVEPTYTNPTSPVSIFFLTPGTPNKGIANDIFNLNNLKFYPIVNATNYPVGVIKYSSIPGIFQFMHPFNPAGAQGSDPNNPVPSTLVDPSGKKTASTSVITIGYSTLPNGGSVELWSENGLNNDLEPTNNYANTYNFHLSFYNSNNVLLNDYVINYTANLTGGLINSPADPTSVNCSVNQDVNNNQRNCGTLLSITPSINLVHGTSLLAYGKDFPSITDGKVGPVGQEDKQFYLNEAANSNVPETGIVIPYFGFSNTDPNDVSNSHKNYLAIKFKLKKPIESKLSQPNIGCFNGSRIIFSTDVIPDDVHTPQFVERFKDTSFNVLNCSSKGNPSDFVSDVGALENVQCGFDLSNQVDPKSYPQYSDVKCGLDKNGFPYTPIVTNGFQGSNLQCEGNRQSNFGPTYGDYDLSGLNALNVIGGEQLLSYKTDFQFSVPKLTLFSDSNYFLTGLGIYATLPNPNDWAAGGQYNTAYPFTNAGRLAAFLGNNKYALIRTLSGLNSTRFINNVSTNDNRILFVDVYDGKDLKAEIGFIWNSKNNKIYSLAGDSTGVSVKDENSLLTISSKVSDYQNEVNNPSLWSLLTPGKITGSGLKIKIESFNSKYLSIIVDNQGLESLPSYSKDSSEYDYFCVSSGNDTNLDTTGVVSGSTDNYIKIDTTGTFTNGDGETVNRIMQSTTTNNVYASGPNSELKDQKSIPASFNYFSFLGQGNLFTSLANLYGNSATLQQFADYYWTPFPYAGPQGMLSTNYDLNTFNFKSFTSTTPPSYCTDYDVTTHSCKNTEIQLLQDSFKDNNVLESFTKLIQAEVDSNNNLRNYVFAVPKCFINFTLNFTDQAVQPQDVKKVTITSDDLNAFSQVWTKDLTFTRRVQAEKSYNLKFDFNDGTIAKYAIPTVKCIDKNVSFEVKKQITPTEKECYDSQTGFDYKPGYQRVCLTVYDKDTKNSFNDSNNNQIKPHFKVDFLDQGKTTTTDNLIDLTGLAVISDSNPIQSEVPLNIQGNSFVFSSGTSNEIAYSTKVDFTNPNTALYSKATVASEPQDQRFKLLIPSSFTKEKFNAYSQLTISAYQSKYGNPTNTFDYLQWTKLSPILNELDLSEYDIYFRLNTPPLGKEPGELMRFYFSTKGFGQGIFDLTGVPWSRAYITQALPDSPKIISYPNLDTSKGDAPLITTYGSRVTFANDNKVWMYIPLCNVAVVIKEVNNADDFVTVSGGGTMASTRIVKGIGSVIVDAYSPTNSPVNFILTAGNGKNIPFTATCSEKAKEVDYEITTGCDSSINGDYKLCVSKYALDHLQALNPNPDYKVRGSAAQGSSPDWTLKVSGDVQGVFYKFETSLNQNVNNPAYREAFKLAGTDAVLPNTELYYNLLEPTKIYFYQYNSQTNKNELNYFETTQSSLEFLAPKNTESGDYPANPNPFGNPMPLRPTANTHIKIAECPVKESAAIVSLPIGEITSRLISISSSTEEQIINAVNEGLNKLYGPNVGLLSVSQNFISKGRLKNTVETAVINKKKTIQIPVTLDLVDSIQITVPKNNLQTTTNKIMLLPIPNGYPAKGKRVSSIKTSNTPCLWIYETRNRIFDKNTNTWNELPVLTQNLDTSQTFLTQLTQNGMQRLVSGLQTDEAFKNMIVLNTPVLTAKQFFTAPQSTKLLSISNTFHGYSIPLCTVLLKVNITDIPNGTNSKTALPFSNATVNRTYYEFTDPLNGHTGSMFLGNNMGFAYLTLGIRSSGEKINVGFKTRSLSMNQSFTLTDSMCGQIKTINQKMCYQRINYTVLAPIPDNKKIYQFNPKAYTDYSPKINITANLVDYGSIADKFVSNLTNNSNESLFNLYGHDNPACNAVITFNHSMFDDWKKDPFCRVKPFTDKFTCQCGGLQQPTIQTSKSTDYSAKVIFNNAEQNLNVSLWLMDANKNKIKKILKDSSSYDLRIKQLILTYTIDFDKKYYVYINDTRYKEWDDGKIIPDDFQATLNETAFRYCATDQNFTINLNYCRVQTPTLRIDATNCQNCGLDNPSNSIKFNVYGPRFPAIPDVIKFNIFWKLLLKDSIKGGSTDPTTWFKTEKLPSQGYYKVNINNLACIKDNQQTVKVKCDTPTPTTVSITQSVYDLDYKKGEFLILNTPGAITRESGLPEGQTFASGKDQLQVYKVDINSLAGFKTGLARGALLGTTTLTPNANKGFPQDYLLITGIGTTNSLTPGDNLIAIVNPKKTLPDELNGLIYLNTIKVPDNTVKSACDRIFTAPTSLSSINFEKVEGGRAKLNAIIPSALNPTSDYGSKVFTDFVKPDSNTLQTTDARGFANINVQPSDLNYNEFRVPGGMITWKWNFTLEGECYKNENSVYNDSKLQEAQFNPSNNDYITAVNSGQTTANVKQNNFIQKGGDIKTISPSNPIDAGAIAINSNSDLNAIGIGNYNDVNPYNPESGNNIIKFTLRPLCVPIRILTTMKGNPQDTAIKILPVSNVNDYNQVATDCVSQGVAKNGVLNLTKGNDPLPCPIGNLQNYVDAYQNTYHFYTELPYLDSTTGGFSHDGPGSYSACVREDYLTPLIKEVKLGTFTKTLKFGVGVDNTAAIAYTPELKFVNYIPGTYDGCNTGKELTVKTDLTPITDIEVRNNETELPLKQTPLCIRSEAMNLQIVDQEAIPIIEPTSDNTKIKPARPTSSQVLGKAYLTDPRLDIDLTNPKYLYQITGAGQTSYNLDSNSNIRLLQGSYNVTSLGGGGALFCGKIDSTANCDIPDYRDYGKPYTLTDTSNYYYDVDTKDIVKTYNNINDIRIGCNFKTTHPNVDTNDLTCIKIIFDGLKNYTETYDNGNLWNGYGIKYGSDPRSYLDSFTGGSGYGKGPWLAGYAFLSLPGDSSNANDVKIPFTGVNLIKGIQYNIAGWNDQIASVPNVFAYSNLLGLYSSIYPDSSWYTQSSTRTVSVLSDPTRSGKNLIFSGCQNVDSGYAGIIRGYDSRDSQAFRDSLTTLQNQGYVVAGDSENTFFVSKSNLDKLKIGFVLLGRATHIGGSGGSLFVSPPVSVPIFFNNNCMTDVEVNLLKTQDTDHCLELTINVTGDMLGSSFTDNNGGNYYGVVNRNPTCTSSYVNLPPVYCNQNFLNG